LVDGTIKNTKKKKKKKKTSKKKKKKKEKKKKKDMSGKDKGKNDGGRGARSSGTTSATTGGATVLDESADATMQGRVGTEGGVVSTNTVATGGDDNDAQSQIRVGGGGTARAATTAVAPPAVAQVAQEDENDVVRMQGWQREVNRLQAQINALVQAQAQPPAVPVPVQQAVQPARMAMPKTNVEMFDGAFGGRDFDVGIRYFDDECEARQWPDRANSLRMCLTGVAREFANSLDAATKNDYAALRARLTARFVPHNNDQMIAQQIARMVPQAGESPSNVFARMVQLNDRRSPALRETEQGLYTYHLLPLFAEDRRGHCGVSTDVRAMLQVADSLHSCMSLWARRPTQTPTSGIHAVEEVNAVAPSLYASRAEVDALNRRLQELMHNYGNQRVDAGGNGGGGGDNSAPSRGRGGAAREGGGNMRMDMLCYNCRLPGHRRRQCPYPQVLIGGAGPTPGSAGTAADVVGMLSAATNHLAALGFAVPPQLWAMAGHAPPPAAPVRPALPWYSPTPPPMALAAPPALPWVGAAPASMVPAQSTPAAPAAPLALPAPAWGPPAPPTRPSHVMAIASAPVEAIGDGERCVATLSVGGNSVETLLDSGAKPSIVAGRVADALPNAPRKSLVTNLRGAFGDSTVDDCILLPVRSPSGVTRHLWCFVVPDFHYDLLLGTLALKALLIDTLHSKGLIVFNGENGGADVVVPMVAASAPSATEVAVIALLDESVSVLPPTNAVTLVADADGGTLLADVIGAVGATASDDAADEAEEEDNVVMAIGVARSAGGWVAAVDDAVAADWRRAVVVATSSGSSDERDAMWTPTSRLGA
jgi:hypothetical protein